MRAPRRLFGDKAAAAAGDAPPEPPSLLVKASDPSSRSLLRGAFGGGVSKAMDWNKETDLEAGVAEKPEEQQQSSEPEPDTDADRRLGAGGVLSLQVRTPPHPPSRVFHTRVSLAHRNVSGVIAIVRGGELALILTF